MNLKKPSVLADGENKGNSQKNCYLNSRNKKWIFGDSNIKPQYQYIQAPRRIHFSKTELKLQNTDALCYGSRSFP